MVMCWMNYNLLLALSLHVAAVQWMHMCLHMNAYFTMHWNALIPDGLFIDSYHGKLETYVSYKCDIIFRLI